MDRVLFWLFWGIISFWALRTFYYSFNSRKLEQLRQATIGIDIAVLISFFFNFKPVSLGARTGLDLLLSGDWFVIVFFALVFSSLILLLRKDNLQNKIGAVLHICASIFIFILLYHLWPGGTATLRFVDSALPIALLLLLTGNVSALLFWQQLQLLERRRKRI